MITARFFAALSVPAAAFATLMLVACGTSSPIGNASGTPGGGTGGGGAGGDGSDEIAPHVISTRVLAR